MRQQYRYRLVVLLWDSESINLVDEGLDVIILFTDFQNIVFD